MPFPFTLPTTSSLSFTSHFTSPTHPSLPITASTHRASVRSALKAHKRLSPAAQSANLPSLQAQLESYLPYLLTLDAGLSPTSPIDVILTSSPVFSWRPTLTSAPLPGRSQPRTTLTSLEHELLFILATLSYIHTLLARTLLLPLSTSPTPSPTARTTAITTATRHLLLSASLHLHLAQRADALPPSPTPDLSPPVLRALSSLAHAEATLLAVLKDDPYPPATLQSLSPTDTTWMIGAPALPKVRAHLFARLCLAAAAHAGTAASLLATAGAIDDDVRRYADDLRRVARARACRFLGLDAEAAGGTGEGIAWVRAGLGEVAGRRGVGRRREDAGRAEEERILRALEEKWMRMNDVVGAQMVPEPEGLWARMPGGREMYVVTPWRGVGVQGEVLEGLRGVVGGREGGGESESEGEGVGGGPMPAGGTSVGYY